MKHVSKTAEVNSSHLLLVIESVSKQLSAIEMTGTELHRGNEIIAASSLIYCLQHNMVPPRSAAARLHAKPNEEGDAWLVITPRASRKSSQTFGEYNSPDRAWMAAAMLAQKEL
jgi:hypothetical protein